MANSEEEWVEIIEPQTREKMFANPITGEILTSPPDGAKVKPMSQNQWWELFDQTNEQNYYYNAHTGETVWDRPGDGADIISLTKLQSSGEVQEQASTEPPDSVVEETDYQPGDSVEQNSTVTSNEKPDPLILQKEREDESTPNLSEILDEELDKLSPLDLDFHGQKFSSFDGASGEAHSQVKTHPQTTTGASTTTTAVDRSYTLRHDDSTVSDKRYREQERGSWVNIQLLNKNGSLVGNENLSVPEGGDANHMGGSLDRRGRGRDSLSYTSDTRSRTLDNRSSRSGTANSLQPVRPAPVPPSPKGAEAKHKSPVHSSNGQSSRTFQKSMSVDPDCPSVDEVKSKKTHSRASSEVRAPPAAPPFKPPSKFSKPVENLENFKELAQHRKGFFRKKVTIANMLCWTKEPIKQPMIMTRDKQLKKDACEMFKLVLQYMGDRKSKVKDINQIALEITTVAWTNKTLRDEVYIQLCRQTSGNDKPKSLERGWELFTICLAFFPPTFKFRSYLEGYLWRHVEPLPENKKVPVEVYAQYCHKKVEKMTMTGAKKGLRKPTLEEIVQAKRQPFHPSMFGTTLEEVMDLQKEKFPDQRLPWVVTALTDTVLQLHGPQTEGIFRVPGDIDEVNSLKLHMDKAKLPVDILRDPHVPASLLKLWFRELEEPLIPEEYYQDCIDNCDRRANAISLVESLPDLNKELLIYLVRFLKQFVTPENIEATKMGVENIAMVWAPNFLRCPSDDHTLIFQNTRKEMAFLRLLLKYLDTDTAVSP